MSDKDHCPLDDTKPKTLKTTRKSGYADNCKRGYQGHYHNAHHVVPCTSINKSLEKYLEKKAVEYSRALARFTHWDVNDEPNLMGLPHEFAYLLTYKDVPKSAVPERPQWLMAVSPAKLFEPKYPVHLPTSYGHTVYNVRVMARLDRIWKRLTLKHKKHEPFEANDLGTEIQAVSDEFRGKLTNKTGQSKELWKKNSAKFYMA